MIPIKDIIRLVAQNKNAHTLCRCIARGADGQWKTFVDGKWLLTLPECAAGFPENIQFEHRLDPNALYFGPSKASLKFGLDWWKPESIQSSIDAMLGKDRYTFTAKNFSIPSPDTFELAAEGLELGKYCWTFDAKGFMPLILKHEPFDIASLQAFHTKNHADEGSFGYRATRIISPQREFYVMMEAL